MSCIMAERDSQMPGQLRLLLDANAAENWRKFFVQFEIYLVAKGEDDKANKLKVICCYIVLDQKLSKNTVTLCLPMKKTKIAIKMSVGNLRNCAWVLEM